MAMPTCNECCTFVRTIKANPKEFLAKNSKEKANPKEFLKFTCLKPSQAIFAHSSSEIRQATRYCFVLRFQTIQDDEILSNPANITRSNTRKSGCRCQSVLSIDID